MNPCFKCLNMGFQCIKVRFYKASITKVLIGENDTDCLNILYVEMTKMHYLSSTTEEGMQKILDMHFMIIML